MAKRASEAKAEAAESALEKRGETALAEFDYSDEELAQSGFEHQTSADTTVPFVVLLQGLSPMVVDGKAQAGQYFNTVTEQVFDKLEGFLFVPATTRHYFVEWTPREEGGGFHGHHTPDSDVVREAIKNQARVGKKKLENGNELIETFYVYGVICDEGGPQSMAVMAFSSTKIKSYKNWMAKIRQFFIQTPRGRVRPPLRSHLVRFTSEMKKNDKGSFYVPVISAANGTIPSSLLAPSDDRFQAAKELMQLVDHGDVQINPDQQNAGGKGEGEDIPF